MIRVRYGICSSQYSDDHDVIFFESEAAFEAHIRDLERSAETVSDVASITPGTCLHVDDRGDVVYVTIVCHEAGPADLADLPDAESAGDSPYWIEEIAGRYYVVREEYYALES